MGALAHFEIFGYHESTIGIEHRIEPAERVEIG